MTVLPTLGHSSCISTQSGRRLCTQYCIGAFRPCCSAFYGATLLPQKTIACGGFAAQAKIMNSFLVNKRIDLVDFDDIKLFMLEDENSYRVAVPSNRKHQNLEDFQKAILRDGPRPSLVTPDNVGKITSARHGVFLTMHHLWTLGVDFDVFDVGSHIGDFGLKTASFMRTHGKKNRV